MRPSRSHPLPLPPPPLSLPSADPPSRRHRASSASPSPAPSPDRVASVSSSSVVPFSWERHPGIPKSSLISSGSGASAPLPLPPPLLRGASPHRQRRRRRSAEDGARASADPFVAAFVECTRPGEEEEDDDETTQQHMKLYPSAIRKAPSSSAVSGRPWWLAGGGLVGLLDLYGCKSAIAVADGALLARRPIPSRR